MADRVSVVIPVYKEAKKLEDILSVLVEEETAFEKEIVVEIDEPDSKVYEIADKFKDQALFIFSKERRGKVDALNDALSRCGGDLIVFLDNDVTIKSEDFLQKIHDLMEGYDIGEIKKTSVKKGFLGRMIFYDYLTFSVASYIFYRKLQRSAGINGAGFVLSRHAVKTLGGFKKTVLEDMDTGYRSFFHNLRFRFLHEVEVAVDPPSTWREWLNQRKRWVIGTALWIKEYFFHLKKTVKRYKRLSFISSLILFPTGLFPVAAFLSNLSPFSGIALIFLYFIVGYFGPLFPFALLLSYGMTFLLLRSFLFLNAYFAGYLLYIYRHARRISYPVNPIWFYIYFFVYAPIWFMLLVAGFIRVFIFKKADIEGWKI